MTLTETTETIARRYSCRAFGDRPVPDDVLKAILLAGLHAPSAVNRQPWRLVVVRDKALIDQIDVIGVETLKTADPAGYERTMGRGGLMLYNTPVLVLIAAEEDDNKYVDLDCGIVTATMALAATSLGVDSCIAAMPRNSFTGEAGAALAAQAGIPAGFRFALSLMLGYASGEPRPGHDIDPSKVIGLDVG